MGGRRPALGERGFTMVELLVTLAVAGIGLTGVMATLVVTSRTNLQASESADAVAIARQTMEEARGRTLGELFVAYEDDGALPIDWDFGGQTVLGRTTTYLRRIVVEEVSPSGLLRVRVEVTWAEDGARIDDEAARRTVSLELLRTRQEAL